MIFDYAILNGMLQPVDQIQISLFHKAAMSGFGVYEAIKVDRGRAFYFEEHVRRLQQSAAMLELGLDIDETTLASWFDQLVALEPQATWRLTMIVYGAIEAGDRPLIALRPEPLATYPDRFYHEGAAAMLYAGQRTLPACKSLNGLVNFLARRAATQAGALEGLLHHDGYITEGARSNLFAVRQGQLITPPAGSVLSGITRDVVVQLMQPTDHPVTERSISTDLMEVDELFITGTSLHVMPITRVDGRPIGTGQVGPVTKLVAARFEAHYRAVMA